MLYVICPTCGAILSNIQLPYTRDIKELCERYDIDIELMSRGIINIEEFNIEKQNIMDKYTDKDNYCCRMRLGNFSDLVQIIR